MQELVEEGVIMKWATSEHYIFARYFSQIQCKQDYYKNYAKICRLAKELIRRSINNPTNFRN
jgi:hypothetical protein